MDWKTTTPLTLAFLRYFLSLLPPSACFYGYRSVPANSYDQIYCMQLAQNAVHGAMAGYTAFSVGMVNDRIVSLNGAQPADCRSFMKASIRSLSGRRRLPLISFRGVANLCDCTFFTIGRFCARSLQWICGIRREFRLETFFLASETRAKMTYSVCTSNKKFNSRAYAQVGHIGSGWVGREAG